ncbi:MAG: hypothetical protein LBR58_00890 [Propionibacteriaceae bacterium]|jgi:hypothetical protein|nr:hypothetical protein [Propionibacteriaceae bacterium]
MRVVRELAAEIVSLGAHVVGLFPKVWMQLITGLLVYWASYYAAILGAYEAARWVNPWLQIPLLAAGLIVQLTALVWLMRVIEKTAVGGKAEKMAALLGRTLLPFLGIYSGFGFMDSYLTDLTDVGSLRMPTGWASIGLASLNPTYGLEENPDNIWRVWASIAAVAVVFAVWMALDRGYVKWEKPWLGVAGTYFQALFLFVVGLSGYRLWVVFVDWFDNFQVVAWWEHAVAAAQGFLGPGITAAIDWVSALVWPVVADVLVQPIAWLAMAALAGGAGALSLEERLRERTDRTGWLNWLNIAAEAFFGNLDDKVFPFVHAVRRILRTGWAFLGSLIVFFTLLGWIGHWADELSYRFVMSLPTSYYLAAYPLTSVFAQTVALGAQLLLLGAALRRMEDPQPAMADGARQAKAWLRPLVVIPVCVAFGVCYAWTLPAPENDSIAGKLGEWTTLHGVSVMASDPVVGGYLESSSGSVTTTQRRFLSVAVAAEFQYADRQVGFSLVADGRHYECWSTSRCALAAQPGFLMADHAVFEVAPAHLQGDITLYIEMEGQIPIAVDLPLTAEQRAETGAVPTSVYTIEVAP